MVRRNDGFQWGAGFLIGLFGGCCGLLVTSLVLRREYFPGSVYGFAFSFVLSASLAAVGALAEVDWQDLGQDYPWELVVAFGVGTVALFTIVAAGVWAFGGTDDQPEVVDGGGPSEPPPSEWVTYENPRDRR